MPRPKFNFYGREGSNELAPAMLLVARRHIGTKDHVPLASSYLARAAYSTG
jgi:hypothetical protein